MASWKNPRLESDLPETKVFGTLFDFAEIWQLDADNGDIYYQSAQGAKEIGTK